MLDDSTTPDGYNQQVERLKSVTRLNFNRGQSLHKHMRTRE